MQELPDQSVDAILTDPPYAEVSRPYGRLTESEWMNLMQRLTVESRRVLKPHGSAVYILQPNFLHHGTMRMVMWEYMLWAAKYWNMVQDLYWWNFSTPPMASAAETVGLMRSSVKTLIWLGNPDCYRNQSGVLWEISDSLMAHRQEDRALRYLPSGYSVRPGKVKERTIARGGSTPFNLLPISNSNSTTSGAAFGHGAATPIQLMYWLISYLTKPGDLVLDPFMGSGTTALACRTMGRNFIGYEKMPEYHQTALERLSEPYTVSLFNLGDEGS